MSEPQAPWYRDGLAFECTRCGDCCTGAPGYVWVGPDEIQRLADFFEMTTEEFCQQFVRRVGDRLSLIEYPNGECIFWDHDQGCTVYPSRPDQCKSWPFWSGNLGSPEDWRQVCQICPGSGQGRLYSLEEIQEAVKQGPRPI